jgi:hypothetical protein
MEIRGRGEIGNRENINARVTQNSFRISKDWKNPLLEIYEGRANDFHAG